MIVQRVLLDANILISYLLYPQRGRGVGRILDAVEISQITLLMPEELLDELVAAVQRKPDLSKRIPPHQMETFVTLLRDICELLPPIEGKIPALCRDPKDDYLLAYAVAGQADYLVTGDKDLLELSDEVKKRLRPLKIVTSRVFREQLLL